MSRRSRPSGVAIGLETFGRWLDLAQAGDNAAVLLRGVKRDQVQRGQVVASPGSVTPYRRFTAQLHALRTAEGGRRTPFHVNNRPQFYFRTTDVVGAIELGDLSEVAPATASSWAGRSRWTSGSASRYGAPS